MISKHKRKLERLAEIFLPIPSINPNLITISGLLFAVFFLVSFTWEKYFLAIIFLILSLLCDFFDGLIARKYGRESKFGNVLDSTVDRICDSIFIFSLFIITGDFILTYSLLVFSFLISYVRAKIEIFRKDVKIGGIIERPERNLIILVCIIVYAISKSVKIVKILSLILLVLSLITVIQRIRLAMKVL